ncbi:MAG: hypothetical protein HOQ44_03605, partial [Nocardia sp.]|nr:hypothetical protein [Nocardia sp.]
MGKHRTPVRSRRAAGSVVAAGAVPLIATLIGAATAHAEVVPAPSAPPALPVALPALPTVPAGLLPAAPDPAADPFGAAVGAIQDATGAAMRSVTDTVTAATAQFTYPVPGVQAPAAPIPAATPGTGPWPAAVYPALDEAPPAAPPAAPIEAPPGTLRVGDLEVSVPFDARDLNAAADGTQQQLTAFLDSAGIERSRADRVAAQ